MFTVISERKPNSLVGNIVVDEFNLDFWNCDDSKTMNLTSTNVKCNMKEHKSLSLVV